MNRVAERVVVLGQGYVGLPLSIRAVEVGYDVVGLDTDEDRVQCLLAGRSHVDDVADTRLQSALMTGQFTVSAEASSAAGFDVAVISVPTPLREHVPDVSHIEAAAAVAGKHLSVGSCVVLEINVLSRYDRRPCWADPRTRASGLAAGTDFYLGYSPERLDPGNTAWPFERITKVVSGVNEVSLGVVRAFYESLVDNVVTTTGTREAELCKLLENTFRQVNIALVNELAMFAHALDIDVWNVIEAAASKPFGFMPFRPGPGVGGHCLPIDPSYLSWQVRRSLGQSFRFIELANDINQHMPDYVVRRLVGALNARGRTVKDSRIMLLGLAYKRNTADAREAPTQRVAKLLMGLGAKVVAADPHVDHSEWLDGVERIECLPENVASADAVVLLVDHDAFDLEAIVEDASFLLDCRSVAPPRPWVERL